MYEIASSALLEAKNQVSVNLVLCIPTSIKRVWFRVNLKLAQVLYDAKSYQKLEKVLVDLHKWCTLENGEDDPKKGGLLVDIYALEIQLHTALNHTHILKVTQFIFFSFTVRLFAQKLCSLLLQFPIPVYLVLLENAVAWLIWKNVPTQRQIMTFSMPSRTSMMLGHQNGSSASSMLSIPLPLIVPDIMFFLA